MKRTTILMAAFLCLFSLTESPAQNTHKNMEQLNLTQEWDKTCLLYTSPSPRD